MTTLSRPSVTPESRATHLRGWLVVLSVVALIVGLGAGFFVGRVTKADTVLPSDLAGTSVTKLLNDFAKASSSGDTAKIASYFAPDATFTDTAKTDGYVMTGKTRIAEAIASWHELGFRLTQVGSIVQHGAFVAQYQDFSAGSAMAVYEVNPNNTFQNVWIVRP